VFAVIMAGGGGTRLWPKSRENFPKQMHVLCGEKPLVQGMTELLQDAVGVDQVYIITNAHHAMGISRIMPWISDRILIDPYRRDTAAAIGLAAVYLSKVDPNAVVGVFPATIILEIRKSSAGWSMQRRGLLQRGMLLP
jgi:mannose-1-phosphate guanylyltransferase